MRVEDFKKKSDKINSGQRTIHVTSPGRQSGISQKDLDVALESVLSRLASSESFSNSAFAKTEDFGVELVKLTSKIHGQNIQIDKLEQMNSSLLTSNSWLQKRLDTLTTLVEHGPMFSPGKINMERESIGIVPKMVNLGTSEMALFSVEMNTHDN